jgi:predicted small lipoprotein YifL
MNARHSVGAGRRWRWALVGMTLIGLLALGGCGQKGPLRLPPPASTSG